MVDKRKQRVNDALNRVQDMNLSDVASLIEDLDTEIDTLTEQNAHLTFRIAEMSFGGVE